MNRIERIEKWVQEEAEKESGNDAIMYKFVLYLIEEAAAKLINEIEKKDSDID